MEKIISYPLSIVGTLLFLLIMVVFLPIQWICFNVFGYQAHKKSVDYLNLILMRVAHIIGNRYKVEGLEMIPKGAPIIFVSNHCPFSKSYEDRIIGIDRKYAAQGFPVIAINPNDPEAYEEDSFANMQARAREKGYSFPYLTDNTQAVTKLFGAIRTPQAFVLKKENGQVTVQYIGAIDNNAQDPINVTKHYVTDAINNLLLNKPVVTTITKAIGCAIKWKS